MNSLSEEDRYNYVTAIFNTDGAPKYKCSQYFIWPVYLTINELPAQDRINKMVTCGLWFHRNKPEMSAFLYPFIDLMNKLAIEGIKCTIEGEERLIKMYIISCCVDSVARAPMQGIKQYNGYYGCSWCLHPGLYIEGSVRYCTKLDKILCFVNSLRPCETQLSIFFKSTFKRLFGERRTPSAPYT